MQVDNIALGSEMESMDALGEGRQLKSEEGYDRGPVASRMVNQLHNMIQNSFCRYLQDTYPNQTIWYEYQNRVDIMRESETEQWFYEVKPFENMATCLGQAIG